MQAPTDLLARQRQQMVEQAEAGERARRQNVEVFTRLFLSLGPDCIKIAEGSRFDDQLTEAKGLAASRWNLLLQQEQQIERETRLLALRPKKRPSEPGDDLLPDRTIAERERAFEEQGKHMRASLADLKEQARVARKELESFVAKRR